MHTAILSQRRTEPHVSTVNTMTEALDIQRPDILKFTDREQKKKDGVAEICEHQQLSRHLDSAKFL